MNYLVVIEAGEKSFGAYVPDLPGCVAVAESRQEVTVLIREAIEHHVADLRASNLPVPRPSSVGTRIDVRP
ncbi:MAG: type II toxin-antitoxin system HicB family antitoxin [bacterium]|jgi:predicted RNase H-like HicB family nuclease|nr:type II toxin-antitoxin system HicB family antitoxin [Betaproteobacteria bacterium]